MRFVLFLAPALVCAQAVTVPTIASFGYTQPALVAAPGELITIFIPGLGNAVKAVKAPPGPLPLTLGSVTVTFRQGIDRTIPIFQVQPVPGCLATPGVILLPPNVCGSMLAVTAQIPLDAIAECLQCEFVVGTQMAITVNGVQSRFVDVTVLQDHIHFLTQCDVILPGALSAPVHPPLPCAPIVTHADGTLVTAGNPATSGEELVAYLTGLGQTDPPLTTGQPANGGETNILFEIGFNFQVNALAHQPVTGFPFSGPGAGRFPLFSGATSGFVGLYQVNFTVPAVPLGTPVCGTPGSVFVAFWPIQSNVTVSLGSTNSYDGAGICVKP